MVEQKGCEIVFSAILEEGIALAIDAEEPFDQVSEEMQTQDWVEVTQEKNWRSSSRQRCLVNTAAVAFLRADY